MARNHQTMSKHDYWVINRNLNETYHYGYKPERYLIKRNLYLPKWRKKLYCSYNKRDTVRLAKALTGISPLTLLQAKYVICAADWWEYTDFINNIIHLFYPDLAEKIVKDLDILSDGDPSRHAKINSPEYTQALRKQFDDALSKKVVHRDGSVSFSLDTDNEPEILKISDQEKRIMKKEIAEYQILIGQELADFCQNNPNYHPFLILYLRTWAHNYNRHSQTMNCHTVGRQIMKTANDLKAKSYQALAVDFKKIPGWWD